MLQSTISMASTVGAGSVFRLNIPSGNAALISDEQATAVRQLEHEPSMLVLVIDDETSVREAMTALLVNWGHEVVAVGSLADAIKTINQPPDAIIADYRLREEHTGIEAIQKLHEVWGSEHTVADHHRGYSARTLAGSTGQRPCFYAQAG